MTARDRPHDRARRYVGRFAPTPSGPLHFGSLLTAVASFLDARAHGGTWRLRIDDLDTPRSVPGASDGILRALDEHALHWDGPVAFQSDHVADYRGALAGLSRQALCFRCTCSRKDLRGHRIYPGTCRTRNVPPGRDTTVRIRVPNAEYAFEDRLQGRFAQCLAQATGDFVVARRDGLTAYQLAVVVDDAVMGVTDVVRGADLLDNTPRQLFLAEQLGFETPRYLHLPVIADRTGAKLSKRTMASTIGGGGLSSDGQASRAPSARSFAPAKTPTRLAPRLAPRLPVAPQQNLQWSLELLGLEPPQRATPGELLAWAVPRWDADRLPRGATLATWTSL